MPFLFFTLLQLGNAELILNANGDPERFADFDLPVVADVIGDFAGPLAGVLTGMTWAEENVPEAKWLVSFATDAPFLPFNLVECLCTAVSSAGAEMACAQSNGRIHPVFALWPVQLKNELRQAMEEKEMRKIDRWTAGYKNKCVDFEADTNGVDPFFNVNRPENLEEAVRLLGTQGMK